MDYPLLLGIFPQVLLDGIILGFMYALIALGYTMVYGVLEFINFAHSEIFITGAFVGVEILLGLKGAGLLDALPWVLVLVLILAAGMAISGGLAVLVERVAYRPLRAAPRLIPLISAIGVSFFLQDAIRLVESIWNNAFNLVYPTMEPLNHRFELTATIDVSVKSLVVIVAALIMLWGLHVLVNRTKIGTAMRAVAEDQGAASLMGINVNQIISLTFVIGGAMGGAAGVLFGVQYGLINPYSGFIPGLKAFTAAVLGGLGNIPGAMVGGLVLGLLEAFAASYLSLLTGSALAVATFPRSVLVFLLFQGSLLFVYRARIPERLRWSLLPAALLVLMPVIGYFNSYYLEVATQVGIFVALALGLNIVVGLAGLLDLGYVAFFAVGAYSWAIFGSPHANVIFGGGFPLAGWWFYVFLLVGLAVAATTGILLGLPVLRLHGDYLAIVTLGFGEVIRVLANNLDKPINFTNGPKGITPISRPPTPFGLPYGEYFYFLALLIVVAVVIVNRRLENSHIGRAWEAIREDELAARAMGVPLVRMKLMAFACGASFAGVMGVLFSAKQVFINPESFTFLESIGVLAMVILGGMGSIPGAIVGATIVTVLNLQVLKGFSLWLNELKNAGVTVLGYSLADLPTQFEPAKDERMFFGVILVLMMIFRPQGIFPARRRQHELGG